MDLSQATQNVHIPKLHVDRRLLMVAGGVVIIAAASLTWLSTRGGSAEANLPAAAPQAEIGQPLVIERPSDGHQGTALALVAGRPLFPLPASKSVARDMDAPVEMQSITVLSVVPGGFWVGTTDQERVFVTPPPTGGPGQDLGLAALRPGETVNISGRVRPLPDDTAALGVADADMSLLRSEGAVIQPSGVRPTAP